VHALLLLSIRCVCVCVCVSGVPFSLPVTLDLTFVSSSDPKQSTTFRFGALSAKEADVWVEAANRAIDEANLFMI
jgi:hypothetical protein